MQYNLLGNTGLVVSRLSLGTMTFTAGSNARPTVYKTDKAAADVMVGKAIDAGVNFFDTADVYSVGGSEEITGRWLGEMASRDDIVVATKVCGAMGPGANRRGLSRKHIIEACENSLRRLKMDYIDLYQIHRWDFTTPIEETLEALDSLVRSGKVRYLGASSMAAWQFSKALYTAREHGWHRFVSMQNHYNLIYREEEREMIPLCIDQGVAVIPWSPLARGFFAGNRRPDDGGNMTMRAQTDQFAKASYFSEDDFAVADSVTKVAKERGVTPTQIACAWILAAPGVTAPIVGATKTRHLQELFEAVDIKLSGDEIEALEKPYRPHAIIGHEQPRPAKMLK